MVDINLDHISVEHKKEALATYCDKRPNCSNDYTGDYCPLVDLATTCGSTINAYADLTPEEVNHYYELVFGDKEVKEPVEEPIKVEREVDMVNHPPHYTNGMECIDELVYVFGTHAVKAFCLCNVWKYRKRALHKNGQEDLDKADWYMAKYKELEDNSHEYFDKYKKLP